MLVPVISSRSKLTEGVAVGSAGAGGGRGTAGVGDGEGTAGGVGDGATGGRTAVGDGAALAGAAGDGAPAGSGWRAQATAASAKIRTVANERRARSLPMTRLRIWGLVFLATAALFVGVATVSVAQADDATSLETDGGVIFPLNFSFDFCWNGAPCGQTTLTLSQDHNFVTGDGGSGRWGYDGNIQTLYLSFGAGCVPLYTFVRTGGLNFTGGMNCRDGSGGFGTASLSYTP